VQQGAQDPAVVTMKQTLYRTSHDSPMFQALTEAGASKEAVVVVELMARFDEASNIRWARSMEDAGVQVFHGVVGLKTHCKLAMLVRHDEDGATRRYCHLGTGNYNPVTARFYTDLSLLTSDPQIGERVHMVFNYLTAHAEVDDYSPLLVAPLTMAESFLRLIRREQEHAQAGRPAHIVAKMNALLEPSIIQALYQASQAGVEIDLIIRGLSILRPGVKGLSDGFACGPSSADSSSTRASSTSPTAATTKSTWARPIGCRATLFERCEVVFPVRDPGGAGAHSRRNSAGLHGRHSESAPAAARRHLRARQQAVEGRASRFRRRNF
jgi:polyphosphate kinase